MFRTAATIAALLLLAACSSSGFVLSQKAPNARPLQVKGSKVAAVVMMSDEASRRVAEDLLAREITARGAIGIPMYSLYASSAPEREADARAALEAAGVLGLVVLRPIANQALDTSVPGFSSPKYVGYWGGYYGMGWGTPWTLSMVTGSDKETPHGVAVEALLYSLRQNTLVWGGHTKATQPSNLNDFIHQVAVWTTQELRAQGLMPQP